MKSKVGIFLSISFNVMFWLRFRVTASIFETNNKTLVIVFTGNVFIKRGILGFLNGSDTQHFGQTNIIIVGFKRQ